MFDFDAGKLLIIGVVALVVIGPKDLPRVLRQVGQAVGRLRRMASEFQGQFMDAMKEADIQDIRDEMAKMTSQADLKVHFDPVRDIQSELTNAVTPSGPLLAPPTSAATDGFSLPHQSDLIADDVSATAAAAGFAPVVEQNAVTEAISHHPTIEQPLIEPPLAVLDAAIVTAPSAAEGALADDMTAVGDGPSRKRKIVLPKRRVGAAALRQEAQADLGLRARTVRVRRHEATEQ
ncbi:Sec-independent protein translocase protein TatB [Lichenihabitans psoromatis]|uniref:Sec-independent protein translocase protein TatB n=1 Tax=Lichenihabitans psoromatis TaxID=2528642 RepID=UPI00103831C9|nr:Sec-independent protein translocase protein TatB [Lichenihabitans psoromatis]